SSSIMPMDPQSKKGTKPTSTHRFKNEVNCYQCGGKGHIKSKCKKLNVDFSFKTENVLVCRKCGRNGHIEKICWDNFNSNGFG
ncbi:hypothetical protein RSW84_28215, partial [Escherichia coli]|uniref:hypothetical protein n=1 Tax=Escherichia coli TaxID=562 RepID=UPI0028DE7BED